MYLISARDLITDRPERWEALAAAVDALDDRVERWARWRDERTEAAADTTTGADRGPVVRVREVAKPGRRLRTTWGAGTVLIVGTVSLGFVALIVAITLS